MIQETVSVIVPAYNAGRFLKRCVESICNQSYPNLEIILVNDGSIDNTPEICDELAQKDERVRAYHKTNEGEGATRNYGINHANGTLIAFVDSDDVAHPEMIARMHEQLKNERAEMAICSFRYLDEKGTFLDWPVPEFGESKSMDSVTARKLFLTTKNIQGFAWNKLTYKSLYTDNGISYGTDRRGYIDINTTYRLLEKCNRIAVLNDKLYDYYQIEGSLEHVFYREKWDSFFEVMREVRLLAEKEGLEREGEYYYYVNSAIKLYDTYKIRNHINPTEWECFVKDYAWDRMFPFSLFHLLGIVMGNRDRRMIKTIMKCIFVRSAYR